MKTMLFSFAVLLLTVGGATAHTGNEGLTPIGRYGAVQLMRHVQQDNDTGYTIAYNNAIIRMPKMRLRELLDALQSLQAYSSVNPSLPLVLHGGLQLQQVSVSGVSCIRITDRRKKSTVLTPEQQTSLASALQQEVQPLAAVSMN